MRIGILTLHLHENIGGILQAYALQKYLKTIGHETVFINRQPNNTKLIEIALNPKEIIKRLKVFDQKIRERKEKGELSSFISKYISPQTGIIKDDNMLSRTVSEYLLDAIVVGSDQVWKPKYTESYTNNLFLDFLPNPKIKKLTYAASFGGDTWDYPEQKTKLLSDLLKRFDAVSVREDSAVKLCKDIFDVDSIHVIDPTLLLKKEDYIKLIDNKTCTKYDSNYILSYILDPSLEKKEIIKSISETIGLNVISVSKESKGYGRTIYGRKKTLTTYPSIENWLNGFNKSQFVVTDSFHGVAFSIIFNKPFIAIGNAKRGLARFESILRLMKLSDRLVINKDQLNKNINKLISSIDYSKTEKILNIEREKTLSYFQKNLTH